MPTIRASGRRRAQRWTSTPSPQPTSSTDAGAAPSKSPSSAVSKPAMRRLTRGFDDPYLSYVLPVTIPSRETVTSLTAGPPRGRRSAARPSAPRHGGCPASSPPQRRGRPPPRGPRARPPPRPPPPGGVPRGPPRRGGGGAPRRAGRSGPGGDPRPAGLLAPCRTFAPLLGSGRGLTGFVMRGLDAQLQLDAP